MKPSTQDKAEGITKIIAGDLKQAVGQAVGNDQLKAKGKTEQTEGKIQQKIGEIEKVLGH